MLQKVKKALLISDVPSFVSNYKALAEDIGVELQTEEHWNVKYRITSELVILGSNKLEEINEAYYPITVLLLKQGESPASYIHKGITRFIFDYKNHYELLCALFKTEAIMVHYSSADYEELLKGYDIWSFQVGDYDFRFDINQFKYKGKLIYLNKSAKAYLAEWLLRGNKDNSKRMLLCNLRKRLGADFLKDIDRVGQLKGGKNE